MGKAVELVFASRLRAAPATVWARVASVDGITEEMSPLLRMAVPAGVRSIADIEFVPGKPLFRSRILLFGFLPIGHSDLTLLELGPGRFVEQSPMALMRSWRHERRIEPVGGAEDRAVLTDRLTFEPLWARGIVAWFVATMFRHRHAVLRRRFGADSA